MHDKKGFLDTSIDLKWLLTIVFAAGMVWVSIKSIPKIANTVEAHETRIIKLEECQKTTTEYMKEVRDDIKTLIRRSGK